VCVRARARDRTRILTADHIFVVINVRCRQVDKLLCDALAEREGEAPSHIVIICRGRFFKFSVVDAAGNIITAPEIEEQLYQVRRVCDREPHGPGVGALTAEQRTTWFHVRTVYVSYWL
jgi:carnitine O-octanoyltransferase